MTIATETNAALSTETGETLITESATGYQGGPLIALAQSVRAYRAAQTLAALAQGVYWYSPPRALVTLDQAAVMLSEVPAGPIITLAQETRRHRAANRLVRLRQMTLSTWKQPPQPEPDPDQEWPGLTTAPPERALFITVDGEDISARCGQAFSVTGSEDDNRTAQFEYYPPPGALSITSYQGRAVEIDRLQGGQLVPIFRGVIDVPTYNRFRRSILVRCSDLRNERIGNEDQDHLKTITGGIYSPITQREDAQGEAWARELMKTVSGSLDYTSSGTLRYRPWAVGAPRFTLEAGDIHHREVAMEFATRSEITNAVTATIEYRYYQRHAIDHNVSIEVARAGACRISGCIPAGQMLKRDAVQQVVGNVSGWKNTKLAFTDVPGPGWYNAGAFDRVAWTINPITQAAHAMGFAATLTKYISQPKREIYDINVVAPESIEQFGEIAANGMRFAVETGVDPAIYEQRGCVIVAEADDRRGDLEQAIQAAQRIAQKQILEGHRKNYASGRYKPKQGRTGSGDLLPVEIGDTVQISAGEITAIGWVTEFTHQQNRDGDRWTDVKLAVSRVDSAATATEDWTLPAAPGSYYLAPAPTGQLETPDCPAPTGEAEVAGETRFENGQLVVTTPKIPRAYVDEIAGTGIGYYEVKIPRNTFDVSVPE